MFLAVGALLHQLLCFEATPAQRRNYTLAILGVLIPVSTYHVVANEIYVHEIVFGIMVIMVVSRTRKLIRERVKNEEHKKRMGQLATFGVGKWNRMTRAHHLTNELQPIFSLDTSFGALTFICAAMSRESSTMLDYPGASSSSCMAGGTSSRVLAPTSVWPLLNTSSRLTKVEQTVSRKALSGQ
jgi:hypothetical protein